jgi:hypothetical protein
VVPFLAKAGRPDVDVNGLFKIAKRLPPVQTVRCAFGGRLRLAALGALLIERQPDASASSAPDVAGIDGWLSSVPGSFRAVTRWRRQARRPDASWTGRRVSNMSATGRAQLIRSQVRRQRRSLLIDRQNSHARSRHGAFCNRPKPQRVDHAGPPGNAGLGTGQGRARQGADVGAGVIGPTLSCAVAARC